MYDEKQAMTEHDPDKGVYGDCFRTALAALLQVPRDSVPHFLEKGPDEEVAATWRRINAWLRTMHGFNLFSICFTGTLQEVLTTLEFMNPGVAVMIAGKSPRGVMHQVIASGGKVIYDPHPDETGIVGPGDNGYFEVDVLVPAKCHCLTIQQSTTDENLWDQLRKAQREEDIMTVVEVMGEALKDQKVGAIIEACKRVASALESHMQKDITERYKERWDNCDGRYS